MSRYELNYNNIRLKSRRKELRNNMTHAEVILWNHIRRRQIHNTKFRRQFSVGKYVLDFFSPDLKLAIEVDGATHVTNEQLKNDMNRQASLENAGIVFLRFSNIEVYETLDYVIDEIRKQVKAMIDSTTILRINSLYKTPS